MTPRKLLFAALVAVVLAVAVAWPLWSLVTEPAVPGESSARVR